MPAAVPRVVDEDTSLWWISLTYIYIVLGGVPNNPQPCLEPKESLGRNMAKIGEEL
jgi:hypothetical protein